MLCTPFYPMVLLIKLSLSNGYNWEYTLFSDKPKRRKTCSFTILGLACQNSAKGNSISRVLGVCFLLVEWWNWFERWNGPIFIFLMKCTPFSPLSIRKTYFSTTNATATATATAATTTTTSTTTTTPTPTPPPPPFIVPGKSLALWSVSWAILTSSSSIAKRPSSHWAPTHHHWGYRSTGYEALCLWDFRKIPG